MLDLKAKLLAAGLVTQEQVKKVEDDEAAKKQRAKEKRDSDQRTRDARHKHKGGPPPEARRRDPKDPDEIAAKKEHALVEAERWRKRLVELAAAGKSQQYETLRGWVLRWRTDNKQVISEAAERYHFEKMDGSLSHLTVEPDVKAALAEGTAAVVAYMGFNGIEHAVVPRDVAKDIQQVKREWVRALVGEEIVGPPAPAPTAAPADEPVES